MDADGLFHIFHHPVFWPVFLIAVGVWVFVHKMIVTGSGLENDGTEFYRWRFSRAVRSSFWVVLVGALWLLMCSVSSPGAAVGRSSSLPGA